jgi:hypothetical protein
MQGLNWAGVAVAICTLVGFYVGSIKWLVKHYLIELKRNSGSSIKDQVTRLESKVEVLYEIMIHNMKD